MFCVKIVACLGTFLLKMSVMQKLDHLQSRLHMLGAPAERRHHVFMDNAASARSFDPAQYFKTDESLLERTYNRPRLSQLEAADLAPTSEDAPQAAELAEKYVQPGPSIAHGLDVCNSTYQVCRDWPFICCCSTHEAQVRLAWDQAYLKCYITLCKRLATVQYSSTTDANYSNFSSRA